MKIKKDGNVTVYICGQEKDSRKKTTGKKQAGHQEAEPAIAEPIRDEEPPEQKEDSE